eukprot:tig00021319_g20202.t1
MSHAFASATAVANRAPVAVRFSQTSSVCYAAVQRSIGAVRSSQRYSYFRSSSVFQGVSANERSFVSPRPSAAHGFTQIRMKAGGQGQRPSIRGTVFVVDDNIDTDQIIPAEYLTLVPSKPDEYEQLGSYALIGLPDRYGKYVEEGQMKTKYPIIVAGDNFGCGSSREHAPIALGAAGCQAVIAQSYARIFFRNCTATGELYPWECEGVIYPEFKTGEDVEIDFEGQKLINHTTGKSYKLRSLGDVRPVIDAGGLFEFARQSGMIKK